MVGRIGRSGIEGFAVGDYIEAESGNHCSVPSMQIKLASILAGQV